MGFRASNPAAVEHRPAHSAVWCGHQSMTHQRPRRGFKFSSPESCHRPVHVPLTVPKSRSLMWAPSPAMGSYGFWKSRTKPLLRVQMTQSSCCYNLLKRRATPQPGVPLVGFHSISKQTPQQLATYMLPFRKKKINNKNKRKKKQIGRGKTHFPTSSQQGKV